MKLQTCASRGLWRERIWEFTSRKMTLLESQAMIHSLE